MWATVPAPALDCSRGCASSRAAGTCASARSGGRRSIRRSCSDSCASAPTTGCCRRRSPVLDARLRRRRGRAARRRGPVGVGRPRARARPDGSCRGSGPPHRPISRSATSRRCSRRDGSGRRRGARDAVATILRGYARYPQLLRVLDRLGVETSRASRARPPRRRPGAAASRLARPRRDRALAERARLPRPHDAPRRDRARRAASRPRRAGGAGARRRPRAAPACGRCSTGLGIGAVAGDPPARPVEDALVARLTRSRLGEGRRVTWEGQAYRIDVGAAERNRIARVRGRDAQARLDAAWSIFALSDLRAVPDAADAAARLARVVAAARLDRTPAVDERLGLEARTAAAAARRLLERGRLERDWPELRRSLDDLGDALATEGAHRDGLRGEPGLGRGSAPDRARRLPPARLHQVVAHREPRRDLAGAQDPHGARRGVARGRQPSRARRCAGAGRLAASVAETARHGAEPQHGRPSLAGHDRCRVRLPAASPTTRSGSWSRRLHAARPGCAAVAAPTRRASSPRTPVRRRSARRWRRGWPMSTRPRWPASCR